MGVPGWLGINEWMDLVDVRVGIPINCAAVFQMRTKNMTICKVIYSPQDEVPTRQSRAGQSSESQAHILVN